jgi:hypothetical protein
VSKGVSCYRNLNKPGVVWSIKSNNTGRVLARSTYVVIKDAKFVVSQAGRLRVLKQKRKNVHAFIKGTWIRGEFNQYVYDDRGFNSIYNEDGSKVETVRVKYNPYWNNCFVTQNGIPIIAADTVILDKDGAWAINPKYGAV